MRVPQAGDVISNDDLEMIFEAVRDRQTNFPDEPAALSFLMVMKGVGERFRQIQCLEQEWTGIRSEVDWSIEDPVCPNGHSLHAGPGVTIGWVAVE